jgi:hypothetical protein
MRACDLVRCSVKMPDGFQTDDAYVTHDLGNKDREYRITETGQLIHVTDALTGAVLDSPQLVDFTGTLDLHYDDMFSERLWFPHAYRVQLEKGMITGVACIATDIIRYTRPRRSA